MIVRLWLKRNLFRSITVLKMRGTTDKDLSSHPATLEQQALHWGHALRCFGYGVTLSQFWP